LRPLFSGVWRDRSVSEYLFCVRPRAELPVKSRTWQRLVRGAVLAPLSLTSYRGTPR
jgi:hypothetical protein